jgi:hypothetical protein
MKEEKEGSRLYFVLNESITDTAEDGAAEGTMQSASAEDDGETAVSQDSELAEEMKVSYLWWDSTHTSSCNCRCVHIAFVLPQVVRRS